MATTFALETLLSHHHQLTPLQITIEVAIVIKGSPGLLLTYVIIILSLQLSTRHLYMSLSMAKNNSSSSLVRSPRIMIGI